MASDFIAHVEIPSTDLDRSKGFLNKVFGWEFKAFGNGYLLYNTHKAFTVGLRKIDNIVAGDSTIFHIRVGNVSDTLTKAEEAGGSIFRGKTTIPAMGYYALIKDPDGNTIGLFQGN